MAKQHPSAIKKCEKLVNQGKWQQAQQEIGRLLSRQPKLLAAWHLAIDAAIGAHDYAGAEDYARQALEHFESEVNLHVRMAQILRQNGYTAVARQHAERAIDLDTSSSHAHLALANILLDLGEFTLGLEHALQAEKLDPKNHKAVATQAQFHRFMGDFAALENCYLRLHEQQPNDPVILNNLGNVYKDVGRFEEAEQCYRKALELNPRNSRILSNLIISVHYNPDYSAEQIAELAKEWQRRFAPKHPPARRSRSISDSSKRLRLGLVSDGLANHPVGNMITSVLQELDPRQFDLRAYSSAKREDHISYEIKQLTSDWQRIEHLSDDALEAKIRADEIDILFDLSGHNNGNRLEVIARQPAPLIVKWVGGLIGTTGVEAIDYLLSDTIETPEGVDDYYTETLIRMPDDYICYRMPPYAPPVGPSPVGRNGYITFGCLNNPAKINPILLRKWAGIMHQLPNSRLFLKGKQYASESFCERIYQIMEEADIPRSRVILEGPAKHQEFMGAYDKIDIALDSWPYSGGLTTCEAMIMGVPVITMPGPTFAGRHSATHVTNAGFPEWVAEDWEDYERKVVALAKDANHLAELRKTLRETVLNSPLCDAKRFAKFFTIAMRAIWQRHCSGKPPAPLRFNAEGQAYFEGEEGPVVLEQAPVEQAATPSPAAPQPSPSTTGEEFKWELEGRIVTVDHGCNLLKREELNSLLHTKAFAIVVFDPRGEVKNPELYSAEDAVQIIAHNALGDGQPTELHATLDPALTGTLKPCAPEALPEELRKGAQLLAKVPINTHALDNIEGLSHLDWLLLDDLSDAATILKHGSKLLSNALLIDVRIPFRPTHEGQPTLDSINQWASRNGFRFYRFNNEQHYSQLSEVDNIRSNQSTELRSADALYIPDTMRVGAFSREQKIKLAFILHTVYGIQDLAYRVLNSVDQALAEAYLASIETTAAPTRNAEQQPSHSEQASTPPPSESVDDRVNRGTTGSHADLPNDGLPACDPIHVVDIGANPIDGTPPYASLLKRGAIRLVGFEPQREALQKLEQRKGPYERYLPHAVGDGKPATLYLCQAQGMTSTLKPNMPVLEQFQGYPLWAKVIGTEQVTTVRLDDLDEIERIDWLKIDIQGGELTVFRNGEQKLRHALVIQTEANFIRLYENQPLFADIDQWMQANGFMLHTLLEERRRLYAPMIINGQIHNGLNQLTTADAVYIPSFERLSAMSAGELKKLCMILHHAYGSYDLVLRIFDIIDRIQNTSYSSKYLAILAQARKVSTSSNAVSEFLNDRPTQRYSSVNGSQSDDAKTKTKNIIFVVGCGHTGTTLMASILGAHPDIYTIRRETNWFLSNVPFDDELRAEELCALRENRKWICEKTPRHVHCYEQIMSRFPTAKFIVMTRNPKDTVASLKNRSGHFQPALNRWLQDSSASLKTANQSNATLVRYEDLVGNPEHELRKVCNFLEIEFSEDMLNFHKTDKTWFGVAPKETDGKGEKSHLERRAWQMTQPIHDRRDIWKGILSKREEKTIIKACKELAEKLGHII